eukprot:CAMPEP_0170500904 /NCGR_PEP_ID=MMETSP0208-20121228/36475_1 /TAXON_ID=197538 /ORGANISM="Strombidium inclinatum, Strain S3" /LENGTH=80 /DNA_ID=CAMNT_0010779171 /DNA_START=127 /DNA_END=366 /DNA_ORIENTATION=+
MTFGAVHNFFLPSLLQAVDVDRLLLLVHEVCFLLVHAGDLAHVGEGLGDLADAEEVEEVAGVAGQGGTELVGLHVVVAVR